MPQITSSSFIGRVVTSHERVGFSFVDSYGHMSACRYLEFFLNHRMIAPELQQGMAPLELIKQNIGLFVGNVSVDYIRPTFMNEEIVFSSWVQSVSANGFEVIGVMYGREKRKTRAAFNLKLKCVDLKTGKSTAVPEFLPVSDDSLMEKLSFKNDILPTIEGLPTAILELK